MFTLPDDFQHPFELTEEESKSLKLLQGCREQTEKTSLPIEAYLALKNLPLNPSQKVKLKEKTDISDLDIPDLLRALGIAFIRRTPPELIAKFILLDPTLMEIANDKRLKEYWKNLTKSYLFIIRQDDALDCCVKDNKEFILSRPIKRMHTFELREDLSCAEQAIGNFCFLQSRMIHHKEEKYEEKKIAWRVLAIKLGSLNAAYHQTAFIMTKMSGEISISSPVGIKVINATLSDLSSLSLIHGAPGLYLLSIFNYLIASLLETRMRKEEASEFFLAAYQAFSLAQMTITYKFFQLSLRNLTYGEPNDLYERYFSKNNPNEMVLKVNRNIDEVTREQAEKYTKTLSQTFFSTPPSEKNIDLLKNPRLTI